MNWRKVSVPATCGCLTLQQVVTGMKVLEYMMELTTAAINSVSTRMHVDLIYTRHCSIIDLFICSADLMFELPLLCEHCQGDALIWYPLNILTILYYMILLKKILKQQSALGTHFNRLIGIPENCVDIWRPQLRTNFGKIQLKTHRNVCCESITKLEIWMS